ncbi:MAG: hypothetical protein HC830_08665, partial [Bacteroidetes bacterium]|nr:hypothetical protein [Bacteroidota bacterium]
MVNPVAEDSIEWYIEPKKIKYIRLLDSILLGRVNSNPFIQSRNIHPQLVKLKKLLVKYREIKSNGGWPDFSDSIKKISPGDTGNLVRQLAQRLMATNDIRSFDTLKSVFNHKLEDGVK